MNELYIVGAIVVGILLGYFVGYREGKEAGQEEERERIPFPVRERLFITEPSLYPMAAMDADAFLRGEDIPE